MATATKRIGSAALLAGALIAATPEASGQQRYRGQPVGLNMVPTNTNPLVAPGLNLNQYTYNVARLGQAYSNIPPYLLGYNPYPQVANYGPSYPMINPTPYQAPGLSSYNNPYYPGSGLGAGPGAGAYNGSSLAAGGYGDPSLAAQPYYSNPYVPYTDPYGGALRGLADLTSANANYYVTIQKARLLDQQVGMAQLDLRRKIFDEIRYERMHTPSPEDLRVKQIEIDLNRARRSPPLTEVFSGKAINDLFDHLAKQQGLGVRGPTIPLDDEVVKHINVNDGTGGNVGLLKDDGKLSWPVILQGADYKDDRTMVDQKVAEAVRAARFQNPIDRGTLTDLKAALARLHARLDDNVARMLPSEYIENKRYLNLLDDAYKALQGANVGNYFNQKWTAKGKTVAELVEDVKVKGLKFAPATPGDEPYYRALHHALTAYDAGMMQAASAPKPMP